MGGMHQKGHHLSIICPLNYNLSLDQELKRAAAKQRINNYITPSRAAVKHDCHMGPLGRGCMRHGSISFNHLSSYYFTTFRVFGGCSRRGHAEPNGFQKVSMPLRTNEEP